MANEISRITNRQATDFVTRTSRYTESLPLHYKVGEITYTTFSTYRRQEFPETPRDKFATIPPSYEYRPDMVSYETYGTPDFWWKILEANSMKDIYEFKAGLTIRLPDNIFQ